MYTVKLPIDLTESRYGIDFFRGEGTTADERIAALMRKKGFEVTEQRPEPPTPEPEKPTRGRKKAEQEEPVTEE